MSFSANAGLQVLHIDDEPGFADTVATFLERENDRIQVETETDPAAALGTLDDMAVDCIVSDYDMPKTNGIELLDAVREEYPELPFILFTGKGSEEIASEAISAGVTDYMQKRGGTDQYAVLAKRIENAVKQNRAEHRLERTRRRLTELAESSTDCLWMFDRDWEELLFISGYEAVWERPTAKIREDPRDFLEAVHPADRQFVRETMARISGGDEIDVEFRIRNAADETGWVWTKGVPIRDEAGQVVRVVGFSRDITERKRAEREREQETVVLETVLDNLTEGILVEDEDRQIMLANDALGEMLGVSVSGADLVGRDCAEASQDLRGQFARPAAFVDGIERTLADRERREHDELELADGRVLARDYVPYRLPDGEANLWIYRDVTPYKERQRELERQERILETVPEGVFVLDTDGTILDMFGSTAALTGYSREALLGEPFRLLVDAGVFSERAIDRYLEALEKLLDEDTDEEYVTYEVTATPGETTRTYEVRLTLFADEREKGSVGVVRDITERKERERELHQLNEETEFALEVTDSLVFTINLASGTLESLRGPVDSVVGNWTTGDRTIKQFVDKAVHPADREQFDSLYRSLTADAQEYADITFRTHPENADVRWIEAQGFVREQDGERHLVGLATEVTDQRHRQQELERQNDRLEEFAGVVSHDLRNPLTVADGQLALAAETGDPERIAAARSALDRMEALVDDLLVLAKEGERVQTTEQVDLGTVVSSCWGNVATGDATLETTLDLSIHADPSRLKQLLENLFSNAVDHGSADVTVTVGECDSGFYVADDGPGIPPAERAQIFEMGYSTADEGTGFGLAIVEEIAHAHGWTIEIGESESGGTRVEITGVESISE